MTKERVIYFDYLRVFAIFAIIILHIATQNWETGDVYGFQWNVLNVYDSLVRWGVPVFVMISGALFLGRELEIKKLYTKNISRLIVAYFVWSVFYALWLPLSKLVLTGENTLSLSTVMGDIITGAYHMWFIPMIIGLYMCVPIIKKITENKKLTEYYLLLSFVFVFAVPQILNILKDFTEIFIIEKLDELLSNMHLDILLGYSFYFVLGQYLTNKELSKKQRVPLYLFGVVGFAFTILLTAFASRKTGSAVETYYMNFNVNVLSEAVAMFVLFKQMNFKNDKLNKVMSYFSKYSFGAYLVHIFIISVLIAVGINTSICNPLLSVPAISLIVVVASFLISFILNKIPFINKCVV